MMWIALLLAWCSIWWVYTGWRLISPPPGSTVFQPDEGFLARCAVVLVWLFLICTSPIWCPFHLLHELTDHP